MNPTTHRHEPRSESAFDLSILMSMEEILAVAGLPKRSSVRESGYDCSIPDPLFGRG
jgi:hypothetical protein